MLMAGLTLLPALLAIIGPVAFWPSRCGRAPDGRVVRRACARMVRRPAGPWWRA